MSIDFGNHTRPAPGPGPRNLSGIVAQMFRLFGRHAGSMLLLVALVTVPLIIAGVAAFGSAYIDDLLGGTANGLPGTASTQTVLGLTAYLALYVVGIIVVTGAVSEAAGRALAGEDISIGRSYGVAIRRLPHMLGAGLVSSIVAALPAGLALMLVFPVPMFGPVALGLFFVFLAASVYLSVRLMFAPLIALFQQAGPVSAVGHSWRLVSGAWWRTFGLLLLIGLILGVFQLAIGLLLSSIPIAEAIATSLLVLPLSLIGNLLIYMDLRARKQVYRTEHLSDELTLLES